MSKIEEYVMELKDAYPDSFIHINCAFECHTRMTGQREITTLWAVYVEEVCTNMEFKSFETMCSYIESELLGSKFDTVNEAEEILKENV